MNGPKNPENKDFVSPNKRFLYHSFPRAKKSETRKCHYERALNILRFMDRVGLIAAPELVSWNVELLSGGKEKLDILQRRVCFTEISEEELPTHADIFGPISLAFNIQKLRDLGAMPVIYAPQATTDRVISHLSTFLVRGTYHTNAVLQQLEQLRKQSDPAYVEAEYGYQVAPDYSLNLRNSGPDGSIVSDRRVPAGHIQDLLDYVGFNNIPFEHSIAVLSMFLNMFYPTDNEHADDQLGYYRQREWRLIGTNIVLDGIPVTQELEASQQAKLVEIDPVFWGRALEVDGVNKTRAERALLYAPSRNRLWWDAVEKILVPQELYESVQGILTNPEKVAVN